jgi:hypothetical protein
MVIKGFNVVQLLKKTGHKIAEDRITSLAAWSGSNIFGALMGALNVASAFGDIDPRFSWRWKKAVSEGVRQPKNSQLPLELYGS